MLGTCSVVCVTYNHQEFVEDALRSLLNQSYPDLEIIVLDDGSSDDTVAIVRETLQGSMRRHRIVEQENTGNVAANFNRAISEASGEYIAFLSLDDTLPPNGIERKINVLKTAKNLVFAADNSYHEINSRGEIVIENAPMPIKHNVVRTAEDLLEAEFQEIGSFYIQGQVFRTEFVNKVGGFDNDLLGDDIILRTKLLQMMINRPELRFHISNDIAFHYRKHDDNLHKRSFRQIQTVIQWKDRYFPDRDFPPKFFSWLEKTFRDSLKGRIDVDLTTILASHPVVASYFDSIKTTPKWRLRRFAAKVAKLSKR